MFGRGVISTQYGWALERAGNNVEFYVRPGRAASLGDTVSIDLIDGRASSRGVPVRETWPVTLLEEIDPRRGYDLIIVSVNHDQLAEAVEVLNGRTGEATVLIFNNVWADPSDVVSGLPTGRVVWGFPGAGGGFIDGQLRGGLMRTVFLGDIGGSSTTARHRMVDGLFRRAGFSVSYSADFRSWLWSHFVLDAALAVRALSVGGFSPVLASRTELERAIHLARELSEVIRFRGGRLGLGSRALNWLPARLMTLAAQRFLGPDTLANRIMAAVDHSAHGAAAATAAYPSDVLATARRYEVGVPLLEEAATRFPIIDERARMLSPLTTTTSSPRGRTPSTLQEPADRSGPCE